jgi:hypothetical protein
MYSNEAKELFWGFCEKCPHHGEDDCKRPEGVCEVDDAYNWVDAIENYTEDDIDNIEIVFDVIKEAIDTYESQDMKYTEARSKLVQLYYAYDDIVYKYFPQLSRCKRKSNISLV